MPAVGGEIVKTDERVRGHSLARHGSRSKPVRVLVAAIL